MQVGNSVSVTYSSIESVNSADFADAPVDADIQVYADNVMLNSATDSDDGNGVVEEKVYDVEKLVERIADTANSYVVGAPVDANAPSTTKAIINSADVVDAPVDAGAPVDVDK